MSTADAARVIQRCQRARAFRRWPNLKELRTLYIDAGVEQAIQDGRDATFYRDSKLVARDALRNDPAVQRALGMAWDACSQGQTVLNRDSYFAMSRKLYLALSSHQASISPTDWQRCVPLMFANPSQTPLIAGRARDGTLCAAACASAFE
jgi:hypothetical protein